MIKRNADAISPWILFHVPHHSALECAADSMLEKYGRCLVIDCHSYPSAALPCELNISAMRPEICLGTDPFHTSENLFQQALNYFASQKIVVERDVPFQGALVPASGYQKDPRVSALMIEIRRDLYMNEISGERHRGFDRLSSVPRDFFS
jgi:N-formylglutamate deformylase